jgi:heat-inducible transcriptional repressor
MQENVLDARARDILRTVVVGYIVTGEPVGSRTVARMTREGLSPASVRNVMADLEEMGFLVQPHTSAGRVPTDRAYRFYVDTLAGPESLPSEEQAVIRDSLARLGAEPGHAMEAVPKLLSRLSHQVGCFVSPPIADAILRHIEFVRLGERRVVALFVDRASNVSHRLLETEEDYSQPDLDRAGRYLAEEFSGKSLREIRTALVALMAQEKAAFDRLLRSAIRLGVSTLMAEPEERRLVLEGTTNIMKAPEFADIGTMRRLFETFEEKHRLVGLLDRCLDQQGVQVVIGSEAEDPDLNQLSLVLSRYQGEEGASGVFGILGPTRMPYDRAVALVDYISRLLAGSLTRHPG